MLPDYLSKAAPNPAGKRAPWYANTAPSYAGIFLWVAFYKTMGAGTLSHAGLGVCLAGLVVAGLLCHALFYVAPAMLGMKTGFPLYVLGSSTFGTKGGYVMPGLLMGLLQIGWFAVATSVASDFILRAIGSNATPGSVPYIVTGIIWGGVFAFVGAKGIQYVAKVSTFLSFVPLLMLIVVFLQTPGSAMSYQPPAANANAFIGFTAILSIVMGFSATAGAAGADFGTNSRDGNDVRWGGLVGISLAALLAGGLSLAAVAAANAADPKVGFDFTAVIQKLGGPVGSSTFFLFALASIPSTCFCIFIAGNSFNTMIPSVPRVASSMAAGAVGIVLAVTGVAANLAGFFGLVGASFGPICGAMAADYLLSGRRWAGPREGVNFAGYAAWLVGFIFGIAPNFVSAELKPYMEPAPLYSFIAGFVVYAALAKAGLQPKSVEMPKQAA